MAATIKDALDAVQAAKSRVDTDVAALNATIADLQAQLGSTTVDLQPIVDAANAIDPAPAPSVAEPVASADEPAA